MNAFHAKLAESGLTPEHGELLGMRHLTPEESNELQEHVDQREAMLIPYFDTDGTERPRMWRLRYLVEEERTGFSKMVKKKDKKKGNRYTQPSGVLPQAYFPPAIDNTTWADYLEQRGEHDCLRRLMITEGEFKAACATASGYPTIGLGGVSNISSSKRLIDLIDDLDTIDWERREVLLVFDSDIIDKVPVQQALLKLSDKLVERGAIVKNVRIPADQPAKGLDDFIVLHGLEELEKLLAAAEEFDLSRELHQLNTEVVLASDIETFIVLETGARLRSSTFHLKYKPRIITKWVPGKKGDMKSKDVPVTEEWVSWHHRHTVNGIVYDPGQNRITEDDHFNLWSGWPVEPVEGDISLWEALLDSVFSGDREKIDWFEKWVAYPIQNPGAKMLSAVIVWGAAQGTGKTLIGDVVGRVYGDVQQMGERGNYSCVTTGDLTDNYNDWLAGKQFIQGDEISGGDKRATAELVKRLITSQQVRVREKYVASFLIRDCANYYFTSNHPDPIHVERDDRRFFIHEVTSARLTESFAAEIVQWAYHGTGPENLMHRMLTLDLGDFNPSASAPLTRDREEMIRDSGSELDGWISDVLNEPGDVLGNGDETISDLWTAEDLLKAFDPEEKGRIKANGMGRALKRLGVAKYPGQVGVDGQRKRFYILRNASQWLGMEPADLAAHWLQFHKRSKY